VNTSPKYDREKVGEAILFEVIEQHPTRLSVEEIMLRIVSDSDDTAEVQTAGEAMLDLRRSGLVRFRNDDRLVEPTQAALRAHALFT
jgi:hypothetical protein